MSGNHNQTQIRGRRLHPDLQRTPTLADPPTPHAISVAELAAEIEALKRENRKLTVDNQAMLSVLAERIAA